MQLTIFNSLKKAKETFKPKSEKQIGMYVCGPTVYDFPHLGNCRALVFFDLLYRVLILLYNKSNIRYVRNITDIDDKIINKAKEKNISISELTKQITTDFHRSMLYLNCLPPTHEPKATEHLNEMIDIIEILLEKDYAYKADGHVYFAVNKFSNYYALAGRSAETQLDQVRKQASSGKRNVADFVLWKPAEDEDASDAQYDSPFGPGRPGWHIECSAMSRKYLDVDFDIHGGGCDLIFPHHTNEIAQSCAAHPGSTYAKYWVHNGFLTVDGEKMSKSLGNFITMKDIMDKNISADAVRLFLLKTHYRKPLNYTEKSLSDCEKMINNWQNTIEQFDINPSLDISNIAPIPQHFIDYLLDDFNTNMAITIINDLSKNATLTANKQEGRQIALQMIACAQFMGLLSSPNNRAKNNNINNLNISKEEILEIIAQRTQAKLDKKWQEADDLRNKLLNLGITITDNKDGSTSFE